MKEAPSIYMMDENGKPVPMLGWTLKDFEELQQRAEAHTQPDQPPRYILQSLSATGAAKADYAELTIRLKVWTRDERWTRVPLGLEQALFLSDPVQYKGGGECFLHLDGEGTGHVAWIRGGAEQQHELTLNVWVPLTTVGDETRMWLSAPPDTSSDLKLTVPLAGAVGEVPEGAKLSSTSPGGSEATEFQARWPGGDFELKWHKPDTRPSAIRPVLDAEGTVLAKIDRRSVMAEVNLKVRGAGGPFDRFRVLLPKGAELIPGNALGYSITAVAGGDATAEEVLVEVRRDKKLPEPMQVRFTTRQSRAAAGPGGWFELGGFDVIDAVQQRGHVAVTTVGDWQVRCIPGRGVRQIDALPEEIQQQFQNEDVVARFEYFTQPFSLTTRVLEMKAHVRVEPESEYRIEVDENQVRLKADLKYTVRGAKVFALDVDLPGWQLDEVGPAGVVAEVDVPGDRSGVVSIPLLQPTMGEIEVWIHAHQAIQPGTSSLSLRLPRPHADSPSPAKVKVLPADNVELTPKAEEMVGLVRQLVALPREFSYRADTAEALFAAEFKIHAQQITVKVVSEISLLPEKAGVRQTLSYEISYEPMETLTLLVPRSLAASDKLAVLLDGQRLSPLPLPDQADTNDASGPIRTQIVLPEARLGTCRLEIRYPIEMEGLPPEGSTTCLVPLVMPGDGELSGNELFVTTPQGVTLQGQSAKGRWRMWEDGPGRLERPSGPHLSADQRTDEVVLTLQQGDREATVVERAWVQTCLTHNIRRERAVFRFTSERKELELVLPAGVDFRRLRLTLGPAKVEDRKRLDVKATPEGRLVIPLPDDSNHQLQWLEARYVFSDPPHRPGRLLLELPRVGGEVWVRQMYWELVLPDNEHVIVVPQGFTTEYQWGWNGSFWGRQPVMESSQLEEWSGAERLDDVPKAANRYLFSRPGPTSRGELRTANRWLIVLGASSAVLLAGLLLIYVPASRHPVTLVALAIMLGGAALSYPGPALLVSQAASLGLALALLAGLLHRTLGRARGAVAPREPSSSILDRHSTQAEYRPPVAGEQAPTETAPVEISMPNPDPNP